MTTLNLWIAISAILVIALIFVWWPHVRRINDNKLVTDSRSTSNTQSYQQTLAKLEQQFELCHINQQEFDILKTELARKLIQDEASQDAALKIGKKHIAVPLLLSVVIIGLTIGLYLRIGAVQELEQSIIANNTAQQTRATQQQQIESILQNMAKKVADNPKDTQALFSLAHAYNSASKFDLAIAAFNKLIVLEGEHAEFIGPQAQALYYKNKQVMNSEIKALIDRALQLDPKDVTTQVLLGMDSFVNSSYADAIITWQQVLNNDRPGTDHAALKNAIAQAKERLTLTGEALPEIPAAVTSAKISLRVSISSELANQFSPEQTVFIYAIPVEGARMPLAALKLTAKELPIDVVLDDSLAMTPMAKISDHKQVQLFAIISKSGSAGIKAGDLKGLIEQATLDNKQPYQLIINQVVE